MEWDSEITMGSQSKPKSYPFYVFLIITVAMLVIALFYTFEAVVALQSGGSDGATYQLMMGLFGLGVSLYMFLQFRKRMTLIKQSIPPDIITVVECKKCGFKSLQKFAKGDFVFKTVADCKKCDEPMLITGIYAEKAST